MAFNLPPPPNVEDLRAQPWRDWFWRLVKGLQTVSATTWGGITGTLSSQTDLQSALDAKQVGIQFKDEGSDLGTSGTVSSVDFTGSGVTATRSVNAVTVTIAAGGGTAGELLVGDNYDILFDDGGDVLYEDT